MRHLLLILLALFAAPAAARAPSLVPGDAPELAAPGPLPVGVRSVQFVAAPGRNLEMTLFYPAAAAGPPTQYPHVTANAPAGFPATLVFEGIASAGAAPAPGPKLPLLVFSHGLGRWSTAMSGMAENLASKGYVVASIDHDDSGAMQPEKRSMVFAKAFVRRSQDQRAAIGWLAAFARGKTPLGKDPLAARIDAGNIAVVGYSMGGFGALATGGAGYDPAGPLMAQVPPHAMDAVLEGVKAAPGVRALVLIAPWGGMPAVRAFTPKSLRGITVPSFWIMGDKDDIVGADGIRWLHDQAGASDRRLLVFGNARHNLGGNPPPASAPDTARLRDAIDEPVWRKNMADAIIFHGLTAFLDLTLKGDTAKAAWLEAGPDGKLRGFQNRWQLGIGLTHMPAE